MYNKNKEGIMASNTNNTNKTTSAKTTTTTSTRKSFWGLNKVSFYTMGAAAILYLVSAILALIDATKLSTAVGVMQGIATAIMICIIAILAWKYVRNKQSSWKVLYFVFLLVVILGIIIPLVAK